MNFWMIVERIDNWQIDEANGFEFFGLPEKSRKFAKSLEPGDVLLTYVSGGPSSIADSREVLDVDVPVDDQLTRYSDTTTYFRDLTFLLRTKPIDVLPREHWIPFKSLSEELSATKGRNSWSWFVQTSLRKLAESDGDLIYSAIKRAKVD